MHVIYAEMGGENIRSGENALLGADVSYDRMKNKISTASFTLTQYRVFAWWPQEIKDVSNAILLLAKIGLPLVQG